MDAPNDKKARHLFYEWTKEVVYADKELKRIHRHFYHPQPERILNLMKNLADPWPLLKPPSNC